MRQTPKIAKRRPDPSVPETTGSFIPSPEYWRCAFYFCGVAGTGVGVGAGATGLYATRGGGALLLATAFLGFFFSLPRASRLPIELLLLESGAVARAAAVQLAPEVHARVELFYGGTVPSVKSRARNPVRARLGWPPGDLGCRNRSPPQDAAGKPFRAAGHRCALPRFVTQILFL